MLSIGLGIDSAHEMNSIRGIAMRNGSHPVAEFAFFFRFGAKA